MRMSPPSAAHHHFLPSLRHCKCTDVYSAVRIASRRLQPTQRNHSSLRWRWCTKVHLTACQTSQPPPISAKPAQTKRTSERTTLAAVQWKVPSLGDPAGASLVV